MVFFITVWYVLISVLEYNIVNQEDSIVEGDCFDAVYRCEKGDGICHLVMCL